MNDPVLRVANRGPAAVGPPSTGQRPDPLGGTGTAVCADDLWVTEALRPDGPSSIDIFACTEATPMAVLVSGICVATAQTKMSMLLIRPIAIIISTDNKSQVSRDVGAMYPLLQFR